MTDVDKVKNFLFEVGVLKTIPRTGWLKAGIKLPETVAEHSMRTAILGWVIADMEGADTNAVVKMCLIHDLAESRIHDFDRTMKVYIDKTDAEIKAQRDLTKNLPEKMQKEFSALYKELSTKSTKVADIARDADRLEMYIQAHEYENAGWSKDILDAWKESGSRNLKTKSARKIMKAVEGSSFKDWWQFIYK